MRIQAKGCGYETRRTKVSKAAGLLERMRRNPAADWMMEDVARICERHGLRCSPPSGGGSHYKISHSRSPSILTIPRARPIKAVYIRKLLRLIEEVEGADAKP